MRIERKSITVENGRVWHKSGLASVEFGPIPPACAGRRRDTCRRKRTRRATARYRVTSQSATRRRRRRLNHFGKSVFDHATRVPTHVGLLCAHAGAAETSEANCGNPDEFTLSSRPEVCERYWRALPTGADARGIIRAGVPISTGVLLECFREGEGRNNAQPARRMMRSSPENVRKQG